MKKLLLLLLSLVLLVGVFTCCIAGTEEILASAEEIERVQSHGKDTLEAVCIISDTGMPFFETEDKLFYAPVHWNDPRLFEGLANGNKVLIAYNELSDRRYFTEAQIVDICILGSGSISDFSKENREKLSNYGWIDNIEGEKRDWKFTTVTVSDGQKGFTVDIPEGWEYEVKGNDGKSYYCGIDFWRKDCDGEMHITCYYRFGTDIAVEGRDYIMSIGRYTATRRVDEDDRSYIEIVDELGEQYIIEGINSALYNEYKEEILDILSTVKLGTGTVDYEEARLIAIDKVEEQVRKSRGEQCDDGSWLFTVTCYSGNKYEVKVDPDGSAEIIE